MNLYYYILYYIHIHYTYTYTYTHTLYYIINILYYITYFFIFFYRDKQTKINAQITEHTKSTTSVATILTAKFAQLFTYTFL